MFERYLSQRFQIDRNDPAVRARTRRVCLLVGLILLLSVGDLIVTLTFLKSTGMQELNPLAAYLIRQGSLAGLLLFKFGSMFACVSLILLVRHLRQGEVAAWIATAILVGLTLHWSTYTHQMLDIQNTHILSEAQSSSAWLMTLAPGQ
ncbi:MAG: DUF5658 family protein [Phycisphaerales bacterium]